ncbi:ABC transporter ATP-binding protein [Enterococcus cecorum]|uniref:ABC transporter ATP-binding protein n=1 Tax=Enterococcus cecorum TaxID=44008 RepID=UPI00148D2E15|nr:ABC transporter ATP-binding protein [Enterococcus cecorum]MCJ0543339.1 ABC transporter ATP-binding protein [Enterococcus cecorum]MCJ0548063.1 ABC transporter ATP-binding protein [Enterococcus cecorum]MCJ0564749.1 ABC transporter ATP-binding protein [Enterococcus cecorum]MCJ0566917.1 ABC transporter ATP-binding protein [Enterococcus cecorum]MCJ0593909.1 ABC transporter ATP-binding protein [Enterococcus cecorum]
MKLTIEHLNLSIKQRTLLEDISLKTKDSQFVGLIGANGSGKSTLLKTIYKTLKPDSGEIYLDELNILHSSEKKVAQNLSVVSQFNELSFDLTVKQMVMLGRTPHKRLLEQENKQDLQIVEHALKTTNLLDYQDRSFLSLSGGEKQRVILARAIAQDPQFMILDEPCNHLDIRYQLEIMEIVKNLDIGILAALHSLEDACRYCDELYVLKHGNIIAHGKPKEILTETLIEEVYGVKCKIYQNPITQQLGFYYYK